MTPAQGHFSLGPEGGVPLPKPASPKADQGWFSKALGWVLPGTVQTYREGERLAAHPQQPRIGYAAGLGGSMASVIGKEPRTNFADPGGGGGMNVMASIQNAVKNYRELPEKALAFDWGVEQFCKEAGFDADDTILMLAMLKDPKDMQVIGPVIKEQQKIINDTIEKKLSLSKLQSSIWEKSQASSDDSFNLAEMDEDVISALIQKDIENSDTSEGYQLD